MRGTEGYLVAGRYRLAATVGQGGMGRVWRARDETLDREVAVKELIIPAELGDSERGDLVVRTKREARAAARLRHAGIITIHDVVEDGGVPWVVMELVDGPSLARVIEIEGRLDWRRVAALGADLADALAHAHSLGIVHRDLKPDNVLLAGSRAVITDFGIARILDVDTKLTHTGAVIGTPKFMSPEQLESQAVAAPTDIWSLGATLYAAVEGNPPFDRTTLTALVTAILTQPLPPPEHAGPLAPALAAMLAKAAGQRPDAAAVRDGLRAMQQDTVLTQGPPAPGAGAGAAGMAAGAGAGAGNGYFQPTDPVWHAAPPAGGPQRPGPPGPAAQRMYGQPDPAAAAPPAGRGLSRRAVLGGVATLVAAAGGAVAAVELFGSGSRGDTGTGTGSPQAGLGAGSRTTPAANGSTTRPGTTGPTTGTGATTPATPATPAAGTGALNPQTPAVYTGHTGQIFQVAFNPAAQMLASGAQDQTVRLWDTTTGTQITILAGHTDTVFSVAFSLDGKLLASGGADGTVRLWDVAGRKIFKVLSTPASAGLIGPVAISPDGALVAGGSNDGTIRLWTSAGVLKNTMAGHTQVVQSLAFSPDGKLLASASDDKTTRLWEVGQGTKAAVLNGHTDAVHGVAFSHDGATLGTASFDNTARLWDVATQQTVTTLIGHTDHLETVAFSHDGRYVATGGWDTTARIWDAQTYQPLSVLKDHTKAVESVAFSPDGSALATAGWDKQILVYKLR